MDKTAFIAYFLVIIKNSLEKNLPKEAEEAEFIEKAYDEIYRKLRHIKGGIYGMVKR